LVLVVNGEAAPELVGDADDAARTIVYARSVAGAITVGRRVVGPGQRSLVIAEIGVNHNGDVELAHQLIDAAVEANADAVKFQTFNPTLLASSSAPQAPYQRSADLGTTQVEMLANLALDEASHRALKVHAERAGVLFLSSPFDDESLDLLIRVGVAAIKVASGELTNHGLLRRIAATGLPALMSTGMSTLEEVDAAVSQFGDGTDRLALLHCVSSYPADPADCNLLAIPLMAERYRRPIGWSDHTEGIVVAPAAVALGAAIVEKHITLDRKMAGPDHRASLEPGDFRLLVAAIREVEAARGEARKGPVPAELEIAAVARKSLHWRRRLDEGDVVTAADLIALRPGNGIPPSQLDTIIHRRVLAATEEGALVLDDELGPNPASVAR
jgi:N-acetylneuraminate synthase/N,N'-diacetyllegionaminate synthase